MEDESHKRSTVSEPATEIIEKGGGVSDDEPPTDPATRRHRSRRARQHLYSRTQVANARLRGVDKYGVPCLLKRMSKLQLSPPPPPPPPPKPLPPSPPPPPFPAYYDDDDDDDFEDDLLRSLDEQLNRLRNSVMQLSKDEIPDYKI